MATPIAPSTMATRQIRLSNPVERFRPCGKHGIGLAEIGDLRIGQDCLELRARAFNAASGGRQLEQKALAGAASLLQ